MFWLFFLVLFSVLTGDEFQVYLRSEANTLSLFEETVNTQNGKLVHFDRDIWVAGVAPIDITRCYDGGHHFEGEFGYGTAIHLPVEVVFAPKREVANLSVQEMAGAYYYFTMKEQGKKWVGTLDPLLFKSGFTHNHAAVLHGEPSIYGMRVEGDMKKFLVTLADGTKRHYHFYKKSPLDGHSRFHYQLVLEEQPNGHRRHFEYVKNKRSVTRIWTTNQDDSLTLSWVNFEYKDEKLVHIKASNGQEVSYKASKMKSFGNTQFISETLHFLCPTPTPSSHLPEIAYFYTTEKRFRNIPVCLKEIRWADDRVLEMQYDDNTRVKGLSVAGTPLYTFEYAKDFTDIKDAFGFIRRYEFSNKRLSKLLEQHAIHAYKWNERGEVVSHTISDRNGHLLKKRKYRYDEAGFIIQNELEGEISRLGSRDSLNLTYDYSKGPIPKLVREKHGDHKEYLYTYQPGTNLRTSKITLNKGKVAEREFSEFDANGIEVCKIVDDGSSLEGLEGVTYRKILSVEPILKPDSPSITLPKRIREGYQDSEGTIHYLKTIEKVYTKGDLVAEEKIYDANGTYCYSNHFEYNDRRQLTKETNALGEVIVYKYDHNGNKTYEEKLNSGKSTRYEYNRANQLVKEVEDYAKGYKRITTYTYDAMGRRVRAIDPYGQATHYAYDFTGNEISCTNPANETEHKEYDALGHVIKLIDRGGYVTTTHYNIYGKPLEIDYPDGTKKNYIYDVYGHLIQETNKDGSYYTYELDERDRPTVTRLYDEKGELLKTTYKYYKGPNLILEVDALGHETHYSYDRAGRLITKNEAGIETKYLYDSLGRLYKTCLPESVEVKLYDFLDRIMEERTEDVDGTIYRKVQYSYDINDNRTEEKAFSDAQTFATTSRIYNAQNRLIRETDPEGHTTSIKYHESDHLEKETIDPLKRRTVEEYGILGRLRKVTKFSATGEKIAQHELQYDLLGHKTVHEETLFYEGNPIGKYRIDTQYDAMGQKLSEMEQNSRKTTYTYDKGRLHTITKPDGIVITHNYDPCGRLEKIVSSDGSIHYTYRYDLNDNLIEVQDGNGTTQRSYDAFDRLIHEKQATGFDISYTYDSLDRLKEVQFLNEKIAYTYSPTTLRSASRYKGHELAYTYTRTCDWQGKPLTGSIDGMDLTFSWTKKGQIQKIASLLFTQQCSYDAVGNLCQTSVQDPLGSYDTAFTYDDLDQLIQEKGPFAASYAYDSLNNRRLKDNITYTIDHLNQVTQGEAHYTYDLVGRRQSQDQTPYTYDALGRLTQLNDTHYTYDPFGRRLSKQDSNGTTQYLYQLDTEIGARQNQLTEFRAIFGKQSAFALELNDAIYFPIRNHRGDICVLLDQNHNPVATTRYDAFGKFTHDGPVASPWLFCGQRLDTTLYHFDKREYDPSLGRWLTPDPLGFADGPNLYAYVHNCPLTFVDPTGLLGFPLISLTAPWFDDSVRSSLSNAWHHPRFQGTCQMLSGAAEMGAGGTMVAAGLPTFGLTVPLGSFAMVHGADHLSTGLGKLLTGRESNTLTTQLLQKAGMPSHAAELADSALSMGGALGGAKVAASAVSNYGKGSLVNSLKINRGIKPQSFINQMAPQEALRYERYWLRHAPEQATPYSFWRRYDAEGNIKQVTTYDKFGNRHNQYDLLDSRRESHLHKFYYDKNHPRPKGRRSGHLPLEE